MISPEAAMDLPMAAEALSRNTPTVQDVLKQKRERLVKQLADVDAAIAAVDTQPGLIDAINALRKVGF